MKKCKKCSKVFEPVKGLVDYCSLECRNSRFWSEEDKKKKSVSAKKSIKLKEQLESLRTEEIYKKITETRNKNHKKKIINATFEDLSFNSLRFRILYEQDNKCNRCGLDEWLGQHLVLELDHKNGDNKNNDRDNLEMICPNCHSLTETWRGRNKKERRHRVPDERLLKSLLINDWNMRQALLDVDLSAKGGNYKRCHKLKKEYLGIV